MESREDLTVLPGCVATPCVSSVSVKCVDEDVGIAHSFSINGLLIEVLMNILCLWRLGHTMQYLRYFVTFVAMTNILQT